MIFEMVMGCTCSGKATYSQQRELSDWVRISFKNTKAAMTQTFYDVPDSEVLIEMIKRAKDFLSIGRWVVFEGTFLTAEERIAILNEIKDTFGKKAYYYLVFMDVPKDVCLRRSNYYLNRVSKDTIEEDFETLEKPTYMEGWDIIKTIKNVKEEG